MKKIIIPVSGMHCHSCETLLEKSIRKLPNVAEVNASQPKGSIEVRYSENAPDIASIERVITENGYSLGIEPTPSWFTKDPRDYADFAIAVIAVFVLLWTLQLYGISLGSLTSPSSPTLAAAFIVGITAGFSSCMALVWGLILGISAKWSAANETQSGWQKFAPHLYFNLWRILGFGLLWGVLGWFGSVLGFSSAVLGVVMLAVAGVMILLGISLTGLSPRISRISITLPKFFGKNVGEGSLPTKTGAMTLGAATFFLPCGFTLAMQAYAISTGSFILGALSMGLFALWTAPGLIGIGGLTAFFTGDIAKRFFRFTGVIVLLLGIYNFSNAYTLLSLGSSTSSRSETTNSNSSETAPELTIQEVHMVQDDNGYTPSVIHIGANRKIRLIVEGKSPYSCSSRIVIPSVRVTKSLTSGENIIEFTSPSSGEVKFSCSMGMYTGKFIVDANTSTDTGTPSSSGSLDSFNDQGNTWPAAPRSSCPMMGGIRQDSPSTSSNR